MVACPPGLQHRSPEFIGKSPREGRGPGLTAPPVPLSCDGRGARFPLRTPGGGIHQAVDIIVSKYTCAVRPECIDNNGHMNMGYYVVVFDLATDEWMRVIGLDAAHRQAREVTTFCLEAHVTYHREVREGDPLRFTTRW